MKYPNILVALIIGLSAGCIVDNLNHCAHPENPKRGACDAGNICSTCATQNNGCVPKGSPLDADCLVDPPIEDTFTGGVGMTLITPPTDTSTSETSTGEMEETSSSSGSSGDPSSSSTGPSIDCGNGMLDLDEECDDGNQIETDACLSTCVAASCGDGNVLEGVEACDDGNPDNSDECLVTCVVASCGDNYIQSGEECEDGNTENGDSCDSTCKWSRRKVFVTSASFPGNLMGVAGADAFCQLQAELTLLDNFKGYKAWISDGNQDVSDRFDYVYKGFYVLLNDQPIAFGWSDLTDGTLNFPININEKGLEELATVWTNTKTSGGSFGSETHCHAWKDNTANYTGMVGLTNKTGADWTNQALPQACSASAHLYCFEDVAPPMP